MPDDGQIVPIILAAGASNLGVPKALARFGERSALEIAVENCAGLAAPIVVLGSDAERVRPSVPAGVRVLINSNWRSGQMSSLRVALTEVAPDAHFMLYPVDYPLLTPVIVEKLARAFRNRSSRQVIVIPKFKDRGGHPVIFAAELRAEFESAATARDVVYRDPKRV